MHSNQKKTGRYRGKKNMNVIDTKKIYGGRGSVRIRLSLRLLLFFTADALMWLYISSQKVHW